MSNRHIAVGFKRSLKTANLILQSLVLVAASLLALLTPGHAGAAQLTGRKATIDNSKVAATGVGITFDYTLPTTTSALQGIVYDFCTTPLGTCVQPTGMVVNVATHVSQTGVPTNATAFAVRGGANLGACLSTSQTYQRCYLRTQVATGGGTVQHAIGGITAPTTKQTVYIRIALYSDVSYATLVDSGTVAVAFVDQLTVSGRVQERLNFCVASLDNAASEPTTVAGCVALASSSIDIGIVDNTTFAISPVATSGGNGADNKYGVLMIDTNGSGGSSISYYPESAATGTLQLRNFRVTGATCNATETVLTDQCFRPAIGGATGTTIATGAEWFGMNIPCIFTAGATTALTVPAGSAGYNADGTTTSSTTCEDPATGDTSKKFAWDNSGTAQVLASTASPSVVDREIVKVRFGATASATTPTGAYTVVTTYIATPTF